MRRPPRRRPAASFGRGLPAQLYRRGLLTVGVLQPDFRLVGGESPVDADAAARGGAEALHFGDAAAADPRAAGRADNGSGRGVQD